MQHVREFLLRHFETVVLVSIFAGLLVMNYFVVQKAAFLNFYYLPTLVAGLVAGLRMSLLAGFLSVGFVSFFTMLSPQRFALGETPVETWTTVTLWACFLILTAYVVGLLHQRNAEKVHALRQAYVGALEILTRYIEAGDPRALGHSRRVSRMAAAAAREMGLSPGRVENCRVAGLLHEVGKVDVTEDVAQRLAGSEEAQRHRERYASRSARMIDSLGGILEDIVSIIEYHQDPYCESSVNDDIPVESFIVAVADAYDDSVSDRPHRSGVTREQAIEDLEKWSGEHYSPEAVSAFKRIAPATLKRIQTEIVGH